MTQRYVILNTQPTTHGYKYSEEVLEELAKNRKDVPVYLHYEKNKEAITEPSLQDLIGFARSMEYKDGELIADIELLTGREVPEGMLPFVDGTGVIENEEVKKLVLNRLFCGLEPSVSTARRVE